MIRIACDQCSFMSPSKRASYEVYMALFNDSAGVAVPAFPTKVSSDTHSVRHFLEHKKKSSALVVWLTKRLEKWVGIDFCAKCTHWLPLYFTSIHVVYRKKKS